LRCPEAGRITGSEADGFQGIVAQVDTRKTNDLTAIAGIQYSYNFNRLLFMPAVLTTGSEYVYNKLADKMLGYHRSIDQKVDIYSFFLQNEWKTEQFSILPGGRLELQKYASIWYNMLQSTDWFVLVRKNNPIGDISPAE